MLALDPANPEAAYGRGTAHQKLGALEAAVADFSAVLEQDPNHVKAAYSRGACRNALGQFDKAIGARLRGQAHGGAAALRYAERLAAECLAGLIFVVDWVAACCTLMARPPLSPPAEDYGAALAKDSTGTDARRRLPGGERRRGGSGGSSHASPSSSTSSLQEASPAVLLRGGLGASLKEQAEAGAAAAEGGGSTKSGGLLPRAALPASAASTRQPSRKSSQADGVPVVTRFSVAGMLRQQSQGQGGGHSAGRLESPKISIVADGTLEAQERSGGEASVSGRRPSSGSSGRAGAGLSAEEAELQRALSRLALREGSGSVPLEVGSPTKASSGGGGSRGPFDRGTPGGLQLRTAAVPGGSRSGSPSVASPLAAAASLADEHHARGYALRKQGDFVGAVAEYSRALELDPTHFKAMFNRAFSYDKVGARGASACAALAVRAEELPGALLVAPGRCSLLLQELCCNCTPTQPACCHCCLVPAAAGAV